MHGYLCHIMDNHQYGCPSFDYGYLWFNKLRPRQQRRHFADDIFKCILLNENVMISFKISLMFIPKGPINTIPALVEMMAWRRPGHKPLSELILLSLLAHICVTRPQWVNIYLSSHHDIHDWSKDFHNIFFFFSQECNFQSSVRNVDAWKAKSMPLIH